MDNTRLSRMAAGLVMLIMLAQPGVLRAAEIKVLCSNGLKAVMEELAPQFEKSANHKVKTTWAGTVDVLKRIKAGETFDAVILASDSLEELVEIDASRRDTHRRSAPLNWTGMRPSA